MMSVGEEMRKRFRDDICDFYITIFNRTQLWKQRMSVNTKYFRVIKKWIDGIIIGEYTVEAWTKKIQKLLSDKKLN